jgi:hypothetical protein
MKLSIQLSPISLSVSAFILAIGMTPKNVTAQQAAVNSNSPPPSVMNKFYNYLNKNYSLYLGDSRGACSYDVDPTGIRANGTDRFFLAKISPGKQGTACHGVLEFEIMQADCKSKKLYRFTRERKEDIRFAGWERAETVLYDLENLGAETQSQKGLSTICK